MEKLTLKEKVKNSLQNRGVECTEEVVTAVASSMAIAGASSDKFEGLMDISLVSASKFKGIKIKQAVAEPVHTSKMVLAGVACPRCNLPMVLSNILGGRKVKWCDNGCRIALPFREE